MQSSVVYKQSIDLTYETDHTVTIGASAVKKQATYYTGAKGEEQMTYSQSYADGAVDKTTLYTYNTSDALSTSVTYKDTDNERIDALPAASALGRKTQEAFYTGAQGEELMSYSTEWTGVKTEETIKTTTIYT